MFSRDQAARAVFYIGEGAKSVMLKLEEPVLVIEWGFDSRRIDGLDVG